MPRHPKKLLAILLTLALSLAPLQGVLAAFDRANTSGSETVGQMTAMGSHHAGMEADDHGQQQPCANCPQRHNCQSPECSTGHCPACNMALLSGAIAHLADIPSAPYLHTPDVRFFSLSTSSLYRPPKC